MPECEHVFRWDTDMRWCNKCEAPFRTGEWPRFPNPERLYTRSEVVEIVRAMKMLVKIEWENAALTERWPDIAAELRGKERG